MHSKFMLLLVIFTLLLLPISFAQLNPKSISDIEVKIIKSGTISVTGLVDTLNLSLYIPQQGINSISVYADSWNYKQDAFGNKMVVLNWKNPHSLLEYKIEMIVENSAKQLNIKKPISEDPQYLKETESIVFDDAIRKFAYPYEKTLDKAAELTIAVHDMMEYDKAMAGENKPSTWVMTNKRGVCVEYTNLLAALLRVSGIPARYVVGYAYSSLDNKFTGHSWVEVPIINTDKNDVRSTSGMISFDPTWLQGGYVDATHIKTATLLDNNQTEVLYYIGRGNAVWNKNEDIVDIIDYTARNITDISLYSEDFAENSGGYLKAEITSDECTITDLTANSCIDSDENKMLNIYENEREIWFCNQADIYWVFDIAESKNSYSCPVIVYDQTGSEASKNIRIIGNEQTSKIFISCPDSAGINEPFTLNAATDKDFIFFSPKFGKSNSKSWELTANIPGSYNFYLYSDNAIAKKTVNVIEKKEFSLYVDAPSNVTIGTFLINITATNLLNENKKATIRAEFSNQVHEATLSFLPKETKNILFNLTATEPGTKAITASVMSDSISSYTDSIIVNNPSSFGFLDALIAFFKSIVDAITKLFR